MSKAKELGELILKLHKGVDATEVKEEFKEKFGTVTSAEIIQMEQTLVNDGMAVEEIQRLCDIHADIFNTSIEELHKSLPEHEREGHPIQVLKQENRALEEHLKLIESLNTEYVNSADINHQYALLNKVNELFDLSKHYGRKEMLFFPLLEKYGFDAPPKVMWGVDDEIRADLKAYEQLIKDKNTSSLADTFMALRKRIEDMIFKEEMIMLPMISEFVTEEEWLEVSYDSEDIGYCLVAPKKKWSPYSETFYQKVKKDIAFKDQKIHFNTGVLTIEQLLGILDTLPIDITFIDKDDKFRYFNQAKDRIFVRSKAALGRQVQHCHPPRSVDMVEGIIEDLKSGKKDSESFWIEMNNKFVYISYYAVKNEFGQFIGTLEVSHDIKPYREIQGQKRLRDNE